MDLPLSFFVGRVTISSTFSFVDIFFFLATLFAETEFLEVAARFVSGAEYVGFLAMTVEGMATGAGAGGADGDTASGSGVRAMLLRDFL